MSRRPVYRAFTIIEILIVVGVLAVLMAILLPALRGARVSAGRTAMLSNLRGVGVSFESYVQTYDGYYPFHDIEKFYILHPPDESGGELNDGSVWGMRFHWPAAFHQVAPWREHYRSWINPGRIVNESAPWEGDFSRPEITGQVSYRYSCSFMARPEAWPVPGARAPNVGTILLAGVRAAEVSSPSGKALCFDGDRAYLQRAAREDDPRGVLSVDGAVQLRHSGDAVAPVQNLIDDRTPTIYHDAPGGVRGRDFQ